MGIGVRETQDLIRQIAADSRREIDRPAGFDPQDAGMATGPRLRRRSFSRPGWLPDYVAPAAGETEAWQKLDDDIYKFLHLRRPHLDGAATPPSHQFILEVEERLVSARPGYEPGSYLGLVRLASDLDQTRGTLVTASEKGSFYALARRITVGRREGEYFDPAQVERYLRLARDSDPVSARGMADLLRFMARAARLPLLGTIQEAPALCLSTFLQVVDLAARFNQGGGDPLAFQVSPLDVFLAARSVLFNRSVANPTFSMIRELVLDPAGLYHDDLLEWLQNVSLFGSEVTVLLPPRLLEEKFLLGSGNFSALELVSAGGARLSRSPSQAEAGLHTLGDALVHRIQRQDLHKDFQIRTLLQHFNRLLRSERRSAARVQEDRQQARFDYVQAIRRASEAARDAKTGTFPVMKPSVAGGDLAYEKADAAFAPPSRDQLRDWDEVLQGVRRRLSSQSPVFRALVSQLARVRALDTALAFGLTPGGSRCLGRFLRLLRQEEARGHFPADPEAWRRLESALEEQPTAFLADAESLLLALYGFRGGLDEVQFRRRDRLEHDAEALLEGEAADGGLDESLFAVVAGIFLLELGFLSPPAEAQALARAHAGRAPEPLSAYAAALAAARGQSRGDRDDLQAVRRLLSSPSGEWLADWTRRRLRLAETLPPPVRPGLGAVSLRSGWRQGCERGFMEEVREAADRSRSDLDQNLLLRMTSAQSFLDSAFAALEEDKIRLARRRLQESA